MLLQRLPRFACELRVPAHLSCWPVRTKLWYSGSALLSDTTSCIDDHVANVSLAGQAASRRRASFWRHVGFELVVHQAISSARALATSSRKSVAPPSPSSTYALLLLSSSHTSGPQTMSWSPSRSSGRLPLVVGRISTSLPIALVEDPPCLTNSSLLVVISFEPFRAQVPLHLGGDLRWCVACPISRHLFCNPVRFPRFWISWASLQPPPTKFTVGSVLAAAPRLGSAHPSYMLQRGSENTQHRVAVPALFFV